MDDLIRRSDAIKAITSEPIDVHYPSWYVDKLKGVPSAQPKTGKWIDEGFYSDWHPHHAYRCSVCGEHIIEDSFQIHEYKYCFNCGAKMEVTK